MMKSLRVRLVSIFVLMVILIMVLTGTTMITLMSRDAYQEIDRSLLISVNNLIQALSFDVSVEEMEKSLETTVREFSPQYSQKKVYLLDKDGTVLVPTAESTASPTKFYTASVTAAVNNLDNHIYDDIHIEGYEFTFRGLAKPVVIDDQVQYIVYILESTQEFRQNIMNTVVIVLIAMLIGVFVAMLLAVFFSNYLTAPIIALSKKAQDMATGDMDKPMEVTSNDEIGQLTQNFNDMAKALNETLEEISKEKNKLETVFTHMTDGILVFNLEGLLIHQNPAAGELVELDGKTTFEEIFSFLMMDEVEAFNHAKYNLIRKVIKNKEKYVSLSFAPYTDINNKFSGIICVIQDITEHKMLEEMQKEFVANVSHELRTPITTIKSYTETLLDGAIDDKEVALNFLNVINNEGDRMTTLVHDLLDLSKLDNKRVKFDMKPIELSEMVQSIITGFKLQFEKKNQTYTLNNQEKAYMSGDAGRIEQVLKNIISNAIKYSRENTAITVDVHHISDKVVVIVKDQGIGIPKEDLPRIFERFYRVDKARSREMGGTGLGLAIAKEITDFHKGKISVESKIGSGTTFTLVFPALSEEELKGDSDKK